MNRAACSNTGPTVDPAGNSIIMAKKRASAKPAVATVTLERAARLYRLLALLGRGPQSRSSLTRRLRLGIRGYYRDLEILRAVGINVELAAGKYHLREELAPALERLPFPDPSLNLGEARQLARGRSKAHQKIREQLAKIEK
jgi:predicted DNA-binding transcriptional regulator YafY